MALQTLLSSSLLLEGTAQPVQQRSHGRRLLLALTLLWLPSAVIAALMLAGWWLADRDFALLRTLLWLVIAVHTIVVAAGWLIVAAQAWQRRLGLPSPGDSLDAPAPITLGHLLALSPGEFEERITLLFRSRGYHVVNTPDTADHGIDLLMIDPLGRKVIAQCKRYINTVGEGVVRDLYGTVLHENATQGYLITTAKISQPARQWAQGKPLELIDGERLLRLINAPPL